MSKYNYFLKDGYESLKINMTLEKNRINHPKGKYWRKERIDMRIKNKIEFQNKVYEFAQRY